MPMMSRTLNSITVLWRTARNGLSCHRMVPGGCRLQQTHLVQARIRALAPVIAVLMLAWIPIDAASLSRAEFWHILPLRLALAASLLLLVRGAVRLSANMATTLFVWLQALAFVGMELCLHPAQGDLLRVGYGLFPFMVGAQLAIFPLPWGCSLRIGSAALAVLFVPALAGVRPPDIALRDALWLLGVILLLAAWAGHTQLRLLTDLLAARDDASHDPLTGLANRRSAELRLAADRAHALRLNEPLSLLMLDLDHFKQINDHWGHAAGDRVLKATAQALRDELRGADLPSRFGGEEFLTILPGTDAARALDVAERIRERIAKLTIAVPGDTIQITASIGVATITEGESAQKLVARADVALYRAKDNGRDRCAFAALDTIEPAPP
ncbi:MAG: GGDEF domain-containing protein [Rhodanobacter sp.]|jgi:diguanylate cyclase (GGDEF)-like protein|nr:GGDEF domain-containing protein [Rhodanobacter sp.]